MDPAMTKVLYFSCPAQAQQANVFTFNEQIHHGVTKSNEKH